MKPDPYVGPMTPTAALQLAEDVAAEGFGAHRASLAVLFAHARRRGVAPVLVAIAADPAEPVVARERALGRLVGEWNRLVEAGSEPCGATAA
jgi:hypothetical protein